MEMHGYPMKIESSAAAKDPEMVKTIMAST